MIQDLLKRVVPEFADSFIIEKIDKAGENNVFELDVQGGKVVLRGDNNVSIAMALNHYLRNVCKLDWSWNGNREIKMKELILPVSSVRRVIAQKHRVYMNYCTLCYSMAWWDWSRWEKEIDYMAMKGINMPLTVIGTEAVWFYTLLDFGFSEEESLSFISSNAFWAWQLMTNIEGYQPPKNKKYVDERLKLGKQILERELEYEMTPIQQGYSGHVPNLLMQKYPNAAISLKPGWCDFPKTAQLDPLDPLFMELGRALLLKQEQLLGNYHYYACDPFHEGAPPKKGRGYLKKVGKQIDNLYKTYDPNSVWVMQSWSLRKPIVKAVKKDRLLILDINGEKARTTRRFWGYSYVTGRLHNFGGNNELHGDLTSLASNQYLHERSKKAKVIGTGLFMEGIEQNPVYYDLAFDIGVSSEPYNVNRWVKDYTTRRYGVEDTNVQQAWDKMIPTVYARTPGRETEHFSTVAARPSLKPDRSSPCYTKVRYYKNEALREIILDMLKSADKLSASDGYQFDMCDLTRQYLSNMVTDNQLLVEKYAKAFDVENLKNIIDTQLSIMRDMDELLSHRSELCMSRWICDAHNLATDKDERAYYDYNARLQITLWGDVGSDPTLYDYAYKEWSGLIKEYYIPRWEMYYEHLMECVNNQKLPEVGKELFFNRPRMRSTEFGRKMGEWEREWVSKFSEYDYPLDSDVLPSVKRIMEKY